jgi:hypothetical protein
MWQKDREERDLFEIDFTELLDVAETLTAVAVTVEFETPSGWTDVTNSILTSATIVGSVVRVALREAGTADEQPLGNYQVKAKATTSGARLQVGRADLLIVGDAPASSAPPNNAWTVAAWKRAYLFGLPDKHPETGDPFDLEDYQLHLDLAYDLAEHFLDVVIKPRTITDERQDYYVDQYQAWGYLRTLKRPVRSFTSLKGVYPANATVIDFPIEWVNWDQHGTLNLIPASGTIANFIFTSGGIYLPHLIGFNGFVPRFFSLNYVAGFPDGEIPHVINDLVAKLACISVMNVLGDLIGGVGVLGGSVGMDGLSQFLSMTKTATTGPSTPACSSTAHRSSAPVVVVRGACCTRSGASTGASA